MPAINPCLVIPVYNHHRPFTALAEKLDQYGIPCLLMDDGSSDEARRLLQSLADRYSWLELHVMPENRGKGVAVCQAIRLAAERGFTHALQMDADGQHDPVHIQSFLTSAQAYPESVICGCRQYQDMPPKRRYGRMLTDIWVWINTLSSTVKDSMCGYRLYPVTATRKLIDQQPVGERMDFDTDILVRLLWQGVPAKNLPVRVSYTPEIESHFDVFADNVRISRMHAILFFGMLKRVPKLLKQRSIARKQHP